MTVRELIKLLKECSPNDQVVLSKDPEGNDYHRLRSVDTESYNFIEDEWEIGLRQLTDADRQAGFSDEDVRPGVPCVVLWP